MEVKEKTQIEKINESNKNYIYAYNTYFPKFKWLGNWLEKQSTIFKNEANKKKNNKPNFRRGEIIKVDFGINVGSELSNTHFAIVLNSDDNNNVDNVTVLPLTSKNGYALITQITTISKNKIFKDEIRCYCNKETMELINKEIIDFLTK